MNSLPTDPNSPEPQDDADATLWRLRAEALLGVLKKAVDLVNHPFEICQNSRQVLVSRTAYYALKDEVERLHQASLAEEAALSHDQEGQQP